MSNTVEIYGHPVSQPTRSVLAFCALSSISYSFHELDIRSFEFRSPWFTKINPFQTIPALVHGDYTLWESAAIVTYLADTFEVDNQWYPKDLKIRARINSYLHWHHEGTRVPLHGYIRPKYTLPKFYQGPELTAEAEIPLKKRFEDFFDTLKWLIQDTGYIARTPEASIADIFAFSEISQSWFIHYSLDPFPEVISWYNQIKSIPEVQNSHEGLRNSLPPPNPF